MELTIHLLLIVFLLLLVVFVCGIFTNAVENLGCSLKIGSSAVGSIFAAIGTALPETIVPLVAIIGTYLTGGDLNTGSSIGIGAILGSSFLITTLAMFFSGITATYYFKRGKRGSEILIDTKSYLRDIRYFVISYMIAVFSIFIKSYCLKCLAGIFLICYYVLYAIRSIIKAKGLEDNEADTLILCRICKTKLCMALIILQLIISFILLIVVSHFFISEIKYLADAFKISPLILSILISPVATELPEIINSSIWIKNKKDNLAISNLTGAIVFQSTIPMSIGMLMTPWIFDYSGIVNVTMVLMAILFLYGSVKINQKLEIKNLLFSGLFYALFILIILFEKLI